jgi:hypothetical protein
LDLLVENRLILELKAVEALCKAHYAQVRSYLKATGLQSALLVNFAVQKADYRRVVPGSGFSISESPPSPYLPSFSPSLANGALVGGH